MIEAPLQSIRWLPFRNDSSEEAPPFAVLQVNGTASIVGDDPLLAQCVGAQMVVRVKARAIFPNCPRYIPKLALAEPSIYIPAEGQPPVEPAWKGFADFKDHIHPRQPAAGVLPAGGDKA